MKKKRRGWLLQVDNDPKLNLDDFCWNSSLCPDASMRKKAANWPNTCAFSRKNRRTDVLYFINQSSIKNDKIADIWKSWSFTVYSNYTLILVTPDSGFVCVVCIVQEYLLNFLLDFEAFHPLTNFTCHPMNINMALSVFSATCSCFNNSDHWATVFTTTLFSVQWLSVTVPFCPAKLPVLLPLFIFCR